MWFCEFYFETASVLVTKKIILQPKVLACMGIRGRGF